MSQFRRLSDSVMASPQITLEDIEAAQQQGVSLIVCNRPDEEDPGQLSSSEIREAAAEKNIEFVQIPISGGNFGDAEIGEMADALESAEGQVLAYCRTGTRSTLLWALAEASKGTDPDLLARQAALAGYDLSPVRPAMEQLADRGE
ncbi:TIGR01244 family sulfur transferase [Allopontixanthobacter sp.]|uniref:TIGR01244 family sulfur transferase n=1 Tax=Allopontixanthobacter sp. TaxID=2906452 RepID=UPI002ABC0543|nr:TIGR01244 family sulfur transferase [Allopontixanthobacter sp.]MDZ4308377.1 TIGR01244 family sulfur transferase [Allopontixanthobacter sp.]